MSRQDKIDFGTYHHSTPEESEKMRDNVSSLFTQAFRFLDEQNFIPDKILDAGCGNGFLSILAAGKYSNALITGVDSFEDGSLIGSGMDIAIGNAKKLGFDRRVSFAKGDLRNIPMSDGSQDLIITSLVYHNIKRGREEALNEMGRVLRTGGYILFGDIFAEKFPEGMKGMELLNRFRIKRSGDVEYALFVLRKT